MLFLEVMIFISQAANKTLSTCNTDACRLCVHRQTRMGMEWEWEWKLEQETRLGKKAAQAEMTQNSNRTRSKD